MFKFIHAADIHLDSPLRGLDRYEGAPVAECRGATRRALENLVALAVEERVAFVLIAGDLYDGDWPDYNTGLFFCAQMARLRDARIKVFLIRGNHDAANKMTRDLRTPDNVTMLDHRRPETVALEDFGVALHGQGFADRAVLDNLTKAYPKKLAGLFNIGLLHTCAEGRDGHDAYAPCSLEDLRNLGYGYWALGHIHKRETLHAADPLIAFPGNVQGRSVRETGPKGCLLVTVDDAQNVRAETRWLDVMRWEVHVVDGSGAADGDDLLDRFVKGLRPALGRSEDRQLALRVEFRGACAAHRKAAADWLGFSSEVRRAATEQSGARVWVEKVVARTRDVGEDNLEAEGPLAELAQVLADYRESAAGLEELRASALDDLRKKLGSDLLEDIDEPERLRDLLDQVGPMLLERIAGAAAGP